MTINRSEFIESAKEWIGTPWRHNQCLKGVGVDCVRFLHSIATEYSIDLAPMPRQYRRNVVNDSIFAYMRSHFREIELADAQIGDILVFRFDNVPHHVGLVSSLNPLSVIHASASSGVVMEEVLGSEMVNRIMGVFELGLMSIG
jgi:cell wall-associated NlpC family hydrolase